MDLKLQEDEMIDRMAKEIQQEIDNEIMIAVCEQNGWFKVELERFVSNNHAVEIDEWCHEYYGGKQGWSKFGRVFMFKESKHAEWFSLRWL